jgi:GTP pyrophosphokinase
LLAKEKHEGQFRKSLDPYIQHPIEVAYMLADLHSSPVTIAAGFLHDLMEDTDITKEILVQKFGHDVAEIVDGVTKISQLKYMTKEKALAKSHQKILLAMAKDIRVILVKLIDRVHNIRTLEYQTPEKQIKIAKETMDLYAPLAHRLGM